MMPETPTRSWTRGSCWDNLFAAPCSPPESSGKVFAGFFRSLLTPHWSGKPLFFRRSRPDPLSAVFPHPPNHWALSTPSFLLRRFFNSHIHQRNTGRRLAPSPTQPFCPVFYHPFRSSWLGFSPKISPGSKLAFTPFPVTRQWLFTVDDHPFFHESDSFSPLLR